MYINIWVFDVTHDIKKFDIHFRWVPNIHIIKRTRQCTAYIYIVSHVRRRVKRSFTFWRPHHHHHHHHQIGALLCVAKKKFGLITRWNYWYVFQCTKEQLYCYNFVEFWLSFAYYACGGQDATIYTWRSK